MSDNEQRESIESGYGLMRLALWGVIGAALLFYQAHRQQLGRTGGDGICLGVGSLFVVATLLDVRSGTSSLGISMFKRSEDSTGFWTYVAINGALGGLIVFGALGDLLGLWQI